MDGEFCFGLKPCGQGGEGFDKVSRYDPEAAKHVGEMAAEYEIAPILIFAPTSTDERMRVLASRGGGFL
ncbi:MAG: tryptophan synthase subunit alpha [Desulfocapsaceae bacterium]|nr:tryptophan synthase subunit alpha [Desulfocapsaceae bacterium]